jgi:hypothetical protein
MLIAERILTLKEADGALQIPVRIFLPQKQPCDWICKFTIGWPDGEFKMDVFGVDAFQAFDLAMKTIGVMIYTSEHHEAGTLLWLKAGDGYGFPVTNDLRDMLVGSDKKFF